MLTQNSFGVWQIDLTVDGIRERQSTRTKVKALAEKKHALVEAEMLKGSWGLTKKKYTLREAYNACLKDSWREAKSRFKIEQNWALLTEGKRPILDDSLDVSKVDAEIISDIKTHLRLLSNSGATINRKMAVLRRLLNWCVEQNKLTHSPHIALEKEAESRHRVLTDEEEDSMMRFFDENYSEQAGLFAFLLSSANRLSECLKLTWFNVDFKSGKVTFIDTKSGQTIVKPMTTLMRSVLENRKGLMTPFPYTVDQAEHYWKQFRIHMDLESDKAFVIHCLRHTCATRLVIAGVDLKRVQLWLGHKSYAVTLKYAQLPPEYMSDVVYVINGAKDFDYSLSTLGQSDFSSASVVNIKVQ